MNKKNINIFNILFLVVLFCILISGIFLRWHYLHIHTMFFSDEACLVMNFIQRNYLQLFLPLDYSQCCPPLFLICGKILYSFFGINECALTSINFLASVLSLILFSTLSLKLFKQKLSVLVSVFLFTFSWTYLIHSFFFKHYGTDVLFSLIILGMVLFIKNKKLSEFQMFLLSLFSIFCVFCSYTAGFLIFCYSLFFIFQSFKHESLQKDIKPFLYFSLPFSITMIFYFILNCFHTINDDCLQSYWNGVSFSEIFFPTTFEQLKYFLFFLLGNNFDSIKLYNFYFVLLLVLFALYFLYKKDKQMLYFLISPFVFGGVLGGLHLYPFAPQRVSLYLIPLFILLFSYFFEFIKISFDNNLKKTISFFFTIILFLIFMNFYIVFKKQYFSFFCFDINNWDTSKIFTELLCKSDISYNDIIIGDYTSNNVFHIYDKQNKLNKKNIIYLFNGPVYKKTKKQDKIFFFINHSNISSYQDILNWIDKNCKIIYDIDGYYGRFIKYEKISD